MGIIIGFFKTKAIAVVFALGAVLSVICVSVGVTGKNGKEFKPRLTPPERTNCCYYEENIYYNSGYGMPNCTAYAWGRAYELLNAKPELSTGNARSWYGFNKENGIYKYGQIPKLGAIACFDNEYGGHVAVVEAIDGDVITLSNSAYNGKNFYLTYADIYDKNPGQNGWQFQGYIYPEEFLDKSKRMDSLRKVNALDGLNFREYAGLSADVIDVIPKDTEIYISELFNENGYIWGKAYYKGNAGYCVVDYTKEA